ncbi:TPA: hypothetical protein ACH3X1_009631 [Trebouxia sp. C0004]
MPYNDFQQLRLASDQPEDVALAAFQLLYLNLKHPKYQSIAPCQYNSGKLATVLATKREQKAERALYARFARLHRAYREASCNRSPSRVRAFVEGTTPQHGGSKSDTV